MATYSASTFESMMSVPITPGMITGAVDLESTSRGLLPHRLPIWVREQFPDPQLMAMEAQPSGVTLAFRSRATRIELLMLTSRVTYVGADRPRGRVDLVVDGKLAHTDILTGGDDTVVDLRTGSTSSTGGPGHSTVFDGLAGEDKELQFWLPHNEAVQLIGLWTNAAVSPALPTAPLWVHHGSSISHGSNATSPASTWPAVTARAAGVRLRNLGFGGSALLDPFMARIIRDAPADVISIKMGINIVNLDAMRLRAFVPALHGFLDTVRDGHPTTPLLLVSPLFCAIHEDTPGPGAFDPATLGTPQVQFIATGTEGDTHAGRLTLQVIRRAMAEVVDRRRDENLHYVDGQELYGPADAVTSPLPDGLHPDAKTHQLIGERFAEQLRAIPGYAA